MNVFSKNKDLKFIECINKKSYPKRFIQLLLGCFIVSLSYNIFVSPNRLVPGGVGGLAILLNYLFDWNNSTVILCVNIMLLIISYFILGKDKTKATVLGSIIFPLFVRLTENINVWIQIDSSQVLLSIIIGGLMYGLGLGLIFKAGFTSGGTDIINQIISKYGKLSMGKSLLICDGTIVLLSGIFCGINSMMYSILMLYLISMISDRVILGISYSKFFFIITDKEDEVKNYIIKHLGHGVTIFNAKGGYKRQSENVLMTVLPTKDYYRLKEGIKRIDKDAFYIITDTYEIFGGN